MEVRNSPAKTLEGIPDAMERKKIMYFRVCYGEGGYGTRSI